LYIRNFAEENARMAGVITKATIGAMPFPATESYKYKLNII
jgi:hypothetical protein